MKRFIFLFLTITSAVGAIAQKTDSELNTQITSEIKEKTLTPARVGAMFDQVNWAKMNRKIYVASGTNTYVINEGLGIQNSIKEYEDLQIAVKFTNPSSGAATLNINSIGAVTITGVSSGTISAGKTYSLVYNGTTFEFMSSVGGAGGTQDLQSVLDEGSTATITNPVDITTNGTAFVVKSITNSSQALEVGDDAVILRTPNTTFTSDILTGVTFTDSRGTPLGIQYASNYAAGFTTRSLVDKAYVDAAVSSGSVADGDKGDITVSGTGSIWTIDNLAVTNAKINDVTVSKITGWPANASGALTNNGSGTLTWGSYQGLDSDLTSIAGLSWVQGDLPYLSGSNTWSRLAKATSGVQVLTNTGTSNNPAWSGASTGSALTVSGANAVVQTGGNASTALVNAASIAVYIDDYQTLTTATTLSSSSPKNNYCDGAAGAFTVTLPPLSSVSAIGGGAGKVFMIKRTGATGTITIDPDGSEQIDGSSTSLTITTNYNWITIQATPTMWMLVGQN